MYWDIKLFYLLNDLAGKSRFFDTAVIFFAEYFQYLLIAFFLLLLYFSAHFKRKKLYIFLVSVISVAASRGLVTEAIRFLYHRPRPFLVLHVNQLLTDNTSSFPSGHATFFFAMAAAIYFYNKKWGAWFFSAATVITICRVVAGVHYPSDILGGAVIGIASAYATHYFVKKYEK